jgi:peptide/nickel transport system substrate-binding protein
MRKHIAVIAAGLVALTVALTACGGSPSTTTTAASTGSTVPATAATTSTTQAPAGPLVIGMSSPPNSLDPSKIATGLFANYVMPVYGSLIEQDADGKFVPGLAESWGYQGTGNTTFQVTLRKDLKWADGTPITAADVVASFQYMATGSGPAASVLKGMTFAATGDLTVTLTSKTPFPAFAELLTPTYLGGSIISPAGLKDPAKLAEAAFGAGPYVYDPSKSVSGDHYVYAPNPNYYDQASIHYTSITIKVIPNMNSALDALKSGQIEWMQGNTDVASAVEGNSAILEADAPTIWAGIFLLDRGGTVVPALKDVRVRQALNYAIDRAAITTAVYGKYGMALAQPAVPGTDGYDEALNSTYTFDQAKAKSLLAEAGFSNGLTIAVNYGSFDPDNTKLIQAVQAQLAQVGVTLELQGATNFGGWVNDLLSKKFAATVLSPGSGGSEYFMAGSAFVPGGLMNLFNCEDPQMTTAFNAFLTASGADSASAAQAVNKVAVDNALALPVSSGNTIILYSPKIQNMKWIPGGVLMPITSWTP